MNDFYFSKELRNISYINSKLNLFDTLKVYTNQVKLLEKMKTENILHNTVPWNISRNEEYS